MIHHADALLGLAAVACAAGLCLAPAPARAQCPTAGEPFAQARWLLERGEGFRAAGLYLDALYAARSDAERLRAHECLAQAYAASGQFDRARATLLEIERAGLLAAPFREAWSLGLASVELRANRVDAGLARLAGLRDASGELGLRRDLLAALAAVRRNELTAADQRFAVVVQGCGSTRSVVCTVARRNRMLLAQPRAEVSPALAAVLSAVVPGSGFFYAEHGFDAILHGGATLLAGWLAFDSWHTDRGVSEQRASTYVLGGLAALLYTSNVIASYDTAQRLNQIRAERLGQTLLLGAEPTPLPLAATASESP